VSCRLDGPIVVLLHTTEKVIEVVQKGGPTDEWMDGWPHTAQTVSHNIVSYLETHRDEVGDIPLQEGLECRLLEASAAAAHSAQGNNEYPK